MKEGAGAGGPSRWRAVVILGIGVAAAALVFGAVASGVGEGTKEAGKDEAPIVVPVENVVFSASPTLSPGSTNAPMYADATTGGIERFLRFPAGLHIEPHWHTASETVVVVSGSVTFSVGGEKKVLGPGSYARIPSYAPHEAWVGADGAVIYQRTSGPLDRHAVEQPTK